MAPHSKATSPATRVTSADSGPDVDVVVIGGGVNGTGVARDCALRGLRVALFERNDIGFGASGNSSGMIHGGPRYLTSDPNVTKNSCLDSGHIQRVAPHLLFRIPFLVPLYGQRGAATRLKLAAYDAFFELYDRYQPLKQGKPHALLNAEDLNAIEPGLTPAAGGVSFDEWGIDGVRLCVANAVDAIERGARVAVHTTVTELLRREDGRVHGVRYRDRETSKTESCTASVVVNATGAWAPITASLSGLETTAARVRPGKGIHVFLDRRISNYAIVAKAIDGRQVFLLPWQNTTVLGTTDDDYYGDLDDVVANTDEVRYLFEAFERVFPAVRDARAIGTWGGVRPTLWGWGVHEDALSRDHRVVDHAQEGAAGLFSMIGGKLASYRLFAEEMTDRIAHWLGNEEACRTHRVHLPGGDTKLNFSQALTQSGLDPISIARLGYRHGSRAERIVERIRRNPKEGAVICPCEPVTEAEVRYVVAHELARTVEDVARRTRLGLGACGGMRCAARCGRIVADERHLAPTEGFRSAMRFLETARRRRIAAVGPQQARQEALALGVLRAELGVSGTRGDES